MQTIKLIEISKSFKSKKALNKVSIEFKSDRISGLLGPNGSGKTTLFNIIAGFLSPDLGKILLDNNILNNKSLSLRTKLGISYLPQEASIFRDLSVYDNIFSIAELFHNKENSLKITENLIKQFSLINFQKTKGKLLSGGERRRTEIARALASSPKFLLLDEPFAGIDPIAIEEVKSTISLLKKMKIGMIITDHNVKEALSIVDFGYIIYNGKIIKSGSPNEIISDKFVKKIYLGKSYNWMPFNHRSYINGTYLPPGDKSISHRILILAGQAIGKSQIFNLLEGEDVVNTLKAMRVLGVRIKKNDKGYCVFGVPPGGLFQPNRIIDFGNSGTGIRLISGLISSNNIHVKLVGDRSLSKRPMKRVTEHLSRIGAQFELKNETYPPIKLKGTGNALPLTFKIKIPSAQIKSAIMLSALNTKGTVEIKEFKTTRDHTENMLKSMGYNIKVKENSKHRFIKMKNNKELKTLDYNVPGDPSSAAFFISAACLRPGSKLIVKNMLYNKTRVGFIKTLKNMGGNIKVTRKRKIHNELIVDLKVEQKKYLRSIILKDEDVPLQIDEIPILSIAAAFANGLTIFKGLKELTVKESDRLLLIHKNLKKIGVKSIVKGYDLLIYGNNNLKKGAAIIKHDNDHRILMSFFIANLICKKNNIINDKSCVKTSYPTFFKHISKFSN